jgi:hypothetical protein
LGISKDVKMEWRRVKVEVKVREEKAREEKGRRGEEEEEEESRPTLNSGDGEQSKASGDV